MNIFLYIVMKKELLNWIWNFSFTFPQSLLENIHNNCLQYCPLLLVIFWSILWKQNLMAFTKLLCFWTKFLPLKANQACLLQIVIFFFPIFIDLPLFWVHHDSYFSRSTLLFLLYLHSAPFMATPFNYLVVICWRKCEFLSEYFWQSLKYIPTRKKRYVKITLKQ